MDYKFWSDLKGFILQKLFTILILLLFAVGGLYLMGAFTDSPIDKVFSIDNIIRRGEVSGPGQELNAKGVGELNAGNPEAAVAALREAYRLEPENPVITRNLSIALARMANNMAGENDSTINLLEESLVFWPKNPESLDGLSAIHFRAGRYAQALESATVLKEMMPERQDLAQFVNHLQRKVEDEKGMASETGDRFRLFYSDERKLEYEGEILSLLQTQLDSLTVALGIFPDKPIDVLLLTRDLGDRATPTDPSLEGLYDGQIRLYVGDGIENGENFILTVRHEMVHALLHQTAAKLPGWVHEGVAQLAGEQPDAERLANLGRYMAGEIRKGYRVDLGTMGISFINLDSESRMRAYATSLLFMDYLSRVYSSGFVPRFIAEISSGATPVDALKVLTGRSFTQLQESFSNELEREF